MSPKRGQPPKSPEEKRQRIVFYASPGEKEEVEGARDKEAPNKRIGAYIRDVVVDHAKEVNGKK